MVGAQRLPSLLQGPRLTLRSWVAEDADALTEAIMDSLEELKPFMAWAADEPMSPEERLELFDKWNESWRTGGDSVLGIFADGELGYRLAREAPKEIVAPSESGRELQWEMTREE